MNGAILRILLGVTAALMSALRTLVRTYNDKGRAKMQI